MHFESKLGRFNDYDSIWSRQDGETLLLFQLDLPRAHQRMNDPLELFMAIVIEHIQGNARFRRGKAHFIEGGNVLVFDHEVRKEVSFDGDVFAKRGLSKNPKWQ